MKTIYEYRKVRIVYLILLLGLLSCYNSALSQTLGDLELKLKTGSPAWQLQNPISRSSEILTFCDEYKTVYSVMNLNNGQQENILGSYRISQGQLTLVFDNQKEVSLIFNMVWETPNKFILTNGGAKLIYARLGFADDHFMSNMLNQNSGNFTPSGNTNTSVTCYTCQGVGSCKVCGGSGTYSMFGYSSTCSACKGNGKCWHCSGSGKQ